jgi:hypothetical protein
MMDGCKRLTHIHLSMCKEACIMKLFCTPRSMLLYVQKTFTTSHTYITKSEILF